MPQYQELLRSIVADLEAGRTPPLEAVVVLTPSGERTVDLGALKGTPAEALPVARQYLKAAEHYPAATMDPSFRTELAQIRSAQRSRWRISEWIGDLLKRIIGGRDGEHGLTQLFTDKRTPWVAGGIGLVGLALLVYYLFRGLRGHGAGAELAAKRARGASPDRLLTPDERWAEAKALAASGDWTEGLRTGYLALLQALDKQGLIRYIPAQTNREHERQLKRSQPALAPTFATLTVLVESRLFGGVEATAEDFTAGSTLIEELWREGDALSRRAVATPGASSSAPSR